MLVDRLHASCATQTVSVQRVSQVHVCEADSQEAQSNL